MTEVSALIDHCDPHCIAWARATASLWGMTTDHDLDEPVCLSVPVPVRIRRAGQRFEADRDLSLTSERACTATHLAVRLYFKDGSFEELDLTTTVKQIRHGETANVRFS